MQTTAMLGTIWALTKNAIEGVTDRISQKCSRSKASVIAPRSKERISCSILGYALPVRVPVPEGVTIAVEKNTIKVSGIDKEAVGQAAAEIRALKKPEPYKGKGIHYQGEVIRRKVGKKAGNRRVSIIFILP